MKQITVISGKGGTGKTSLVGSFAVLARKRAVLVDGDVDAANLSLISRAETVEEYQFQASGVAVIDNEKCDQCGLCRELCRFQAISENYEVDPIACEGCGLCAHACPAEAVSMADKISGHWFVSQTPYGTLVHARLGIAEENSGKLVATIRNKAREIAGVENKECLLIDGPPGIGCPVIASLAGVDLALVVTEPTVSGIHDLDRVFAVCRYFGIPAAVCINRFDIDEEQSQYIEDYCRIEGLPLVGKISFDFAFVEAVVRGIPVIEHTDGLPAKEIEAVWSQLLTL